MKNTIRVAIDGPVGAGKSTIARECAARLGFIYVDTGALYRAIGVYCNDNGIDVHDDTATAEYIAVSKVTISLRFIEERHKPDEAGLTSAGSAQRVFVGDIDYTDKIRTPQASMLASRVSANPEVRAFLLELQRGFGKENSVVMDGRDIATVVLPCAEVKIFLPAAAEERARRRYDELIEKGQQVDFETVLADLNKRDYDDSHRACAPLKQADDAILVDTTGNTFEESVERIIGIINGKNK